MLLGCTKRKCGNGKRNGGWKVRFGYVQDMELQGPGMSNRVTAATGRSRIEAIKRKKGEDCSRSSNLMVHGRKVK
jgi:hypothetical protein